MAGSIGFTEDTEVKSPNVSSTYLGRKQSVSEGNNLLPSKVYKVSSRKEINVHMANERQSSFISGICQFPDGTIIIADFCNKRIKRLDENYNIKDYLDVWSGPSGICCIGNTEVAVKLFNNKVQFISVGNTLSKLRDISVTDGNCAGIAYFADMLLVCSGKGVDMYNISGTLLQTVSKDVNGQNIFKLHAQDITVSGDTVYVTDTSDGAVCLKSDGTAKIELRDKRLTNACGICVSDDGTVFIAGHGSYNIVMFDRDGKCLGELLSNEGSLKNPISMCFDKKKHCVIVGFNSNTVVVLYLS